MMRSIPLFILLHGFTGLALSGQVTGTIRDTEGKILPYASVFVKGTNKGTNANSDGKYGMDLEPGTYTLVCQHVGYRKAEKQVTVDTRELKLDFVLQLQEMTLGEVVLGAGEDPAYAIIRKAIEKRTYHGAQLESFSCEVYTKGQLRLRDYPQKLFGQKVDFEDGDTSKQKIIYLSETVSRYALDKPGKEKIEVLSSKVSGQSDGFGLAAPRFFSFYENNISIGNNLNPRGFVSPVSENALNYYKYKLEGSYVEDGREVHHIKITPRRKYEPLFSGYIDIVDSAWCIHSVQLQLTKASQMEILDTLRIEQLYRPVDNGVWFVSSQVMYPSVRFFGFDAWGSFVNIYSQINTDPVFGKGTFNNTILKYTDSSNKKTNEYWEKTRPVPLKEDEVADYKKKDSLETARKDPRYLDSLDKARNKTTVQGMLLFGESWSSTRKRTTWSINPLIGQVNFNPAEGWLLNPEIEWRKRIDSTVAGRKSISVAANIRYGFTNRHLNSWLTLQYNYGKKYLSTISLSGGKRVFQFNNNSPIGQRGNTISCLLSEENRIKSYEAIYLRGSYRKGLGDGFTWVIGFQYQDRMPLENRTDYTWRNKDNRSYTPNYPHEILSQNITRHQVFTILAGLRWQPGTRYIELPDRKINIGSKYPVFSLEFTRGFDGLFGSDADFSKWRFSITDDMNLKLRGLLRYRVGFGGFIDSSKVQVPDYNHFNGNISRLATEYLNSFQLLPIYQFSNTASFYSLAHVEYNLKGFLTNKIPGFRKLNLYLVTGANAFYIDKTRNYFEYFVGLDNIFKQVRIDFVQSFLDGRSWMSSFRIGLTRIGGRRGDDWP